MIEKLKCGACKSDLTSSYEFVDNDNLAVCKNCFDQKLYLASKSNNLNYYNTINRSINEQKSIKKI